MKKENTKNKKLSARLNDEELDEFTGIKKEFDIKNDSECVRFMISNFHNLKCNNINITELCKLKTTISVIMEKYNISELDRNYLYEELKKL